MEAGAHVLQMQPLFGTLTFYIFKRSTYLIKLLKTITRPVDSPLLSSPLLTAVVVVSVERLVFEWLVMVLLPL